MARAGARPAARAAARPATAAAAAAALAPPPPQQQQVLTTIPAGVHPGMRFHVSCFNQLFEVTVPQGYRPGMQLQVAVPAQLPQCAFPTYYLRYLDAVQFLSLNVAANAEVEVNAAGTDVDKALTTKAAKP